MESGDWEDICKKCGKCCYEKVDLGAGEIRYTDEPCRHLDTETNRCKVYDRRHEIEPDCISLTDHLVRTLGWMPADCAYVEFVRKEDTLAAVRSAVHRGRRKKKLGSKRRR